MHEVLSLLMGLVGAAATATAAPILYNINFATISGINPTSGSFMYDAATQQFSLFSVVWNTLTFNLTGAANAPAVAGTCDTAASDRADFFAYLTGNNCVPRLWVTSPNPSGSGNIFYIGTPFSSFNYAVVFATTANNIGLDSNGAFTVTQASATPEPTSWALMVSGGMLIAWKRKRAMAILNQSLSRQ